jgi:hypothetical protein
MTNLTHDHGFKSSDRLDRDNRALFYNYGLRKKQTGELTISMQDPA